MAKKDMPEVKDYGTVEITKHFTVVPRQSGPNQYTSKVMDDTMIDVMLLKGVINASQHATLEMFMRKLHKMGFVGIKSPDYESPVHLDASLVGDIRAKAVRGMVNIFRRLDKDAGRGRRVALVNLCLLDQPWPFEDKEHKLLHEAIAVLENVMGR